MRAKFGEVTLTRAELEQAQKVLENGCSGEITFVFGDSRFVGLEVSEGFAIEPKAIHCMYGCKNPTDIMAAVQRQYGIVSESC
ncbi:MAG: hypothetical protein RKE49_05550 [Oceanicaulis sp.]